MEFATEIATSQVVWAILCIVLTVAVIREMRIENVKRETKLIDLYEDYRKESKIREQQLMAHLERSNDSQEQTLTALQSINSTLSTLESRVDSIEKNL
ncbi:BhlA/UviB family holin-like peptide [Viridibacillus arvi]|uniref:BhlA/UviB family holin-like peptide n=1 Tax=Viridibacillus arvi TaxID=263475 RepID=UPI003D27A453